MRPLSSPAFPGAAILACVLLAACATPPPQEQEEKKPEPPPPPRLVGRIASIPADRRYVLIQSYGSWNVPVDSILTTRGPDERAANLKVTGEALGQFAAADLQSGQVEIGDAVFHLQPSSGTPSSSEETVSGPEPGPETPEPAAENN